MKIYAISGLGADQRVFQFLKLHHEVIALGWITPLHRESITSYAQRLSQAIDTSAPFCLMGVSFGGLIAVEMSHFLNPVHTILISSVATKHDLPLIYRSFGKLRLTTLLPSFFFQPPKQLMYWLFGTQQKQLLAQILDDTDPSFVKWALAVLLTWKNTTPSKNTIRIHGTADRLISLKYTADALKINQGGHFMIVDRADEVSKLINDKLARK